MRENSNPSSPYFLHHSDSSRVTLVSQPLTENNYPAWSRAMKIALSAKNKLGFVLGTVPVPDHKSTEYPAWERCNTMVLSWIWSSVSKELTNSIIYMNSAKEVWEDLQERYAPSNSIQIYQVSWAISSLSQGEMSVTAYYTVLKGYWDELGSLMPIPPCTCGTARQYSGNQQLERVIQFIMGLTDPYSTIRSQLLTMDPVPSIANVYSLVLQEEKQCAVRVPTTPVVEAAALAAMNASGHGLGRGRGRGSNKFGRSQERPKCDFCGMLGHTQEKCYKLHGYPDKGKERGQNGSSPAVNSVTASGSSGSDTTQNLSLTTEQYQQLLSLLNSNANGAVSNFAGPVHEEDDWNG